MEESQDDVKMNIVSRVFYAAVIYLSVAIHFYWVVRFASFIGNPLEVPYALRGLNRFLRWKPELFVDFVFIFLWLVLVISSYFLIYYLLKKIIALFLGPQRRENLAGYMKNAAKTFWPFILLSLGTLCLLPVEWKTESYLATGVALTPSEFLDQLTTATFLIFVVVMIVAFLFILVTILSKLKGKFAESGWFFIGLIVLSIALSIGLGFLGTPYLEFLQLHLKTIDYFLALFASYLFLNAGVAFLLNKFV